MWLVGLKNWTLNLILIECQWPPVASGSCDGHDRSRSWLTYSYHVLRVTPCPLQTCQADSDIPYDLGSCSFWNLVIAPTALPGWISLSLFPTCGVWTCSFWLSMSPSAPKAFHKRLAYPAAPNTVRPLISMSLKRSSVIERALLTLPSS